MAHEWIRTPAGAGDNKSIKPEYISSYSLDRQVQDQEVNEILAPAIELAKQSSEEEVTGRLFGNTDENGKYSKTQNTYKLYNKATGEYGKSITVGQVNMKSEE